MSRRRRHPALVGVVFAALALTGCGQKAAPVFETAAVARSSVTEVVEASATVTPKASARVLSPATGTVLSLKVKDGARVKAGQELLRIDSPQAAQQLGQARKADKQASSSQPSGFRGVDLSGQRRLDAAAARAFETAREAARQLPDPKAQAQALASVKAQQEQYNAASRSAQQAASGLNQNLGSLSTSLSSVSKAQRSQTKTAVALAEGRVGSLVVRAPISGVVSLGAGTGGAGLDPAAGLDSLPGAAQGQASQLLGGVGGSAAGADGVLSEGTPVTAGATLLSVVDTSSLALRAEVDETDVLMVKSGVAADVELDAVPDATYAAKVVGVDLNPTSSSRGGVTYVVRLSLDGGTAEDGSPAPRPRPGMSAVANLRVRTAENALAVPVAAVFRDGKRDAVWVVAGGTAHKRLVRLGPQGPDAVAVADGLGEGERIVVRGVDAVTEGAQVS